VHAEELAVVDGSSKKNAHFQVIEASLRGCRDWSERFREDVRKKSGMLDDVLIEGRAGGDQHGDRQLLTASGASGAATVEAMVPG